MAKLGLKKILWAEIDTEAENEDVTYKKDKVISLGKMASLKVSVSNAEGELYADDELSEYAGEFSSADLDAEVDHISLENMATILGANYSEDDGFSASAEDTAPYGGVAGYQVLQVKGKRVYRTWLYTKTKAVMTDLDGDSKGKNISFGTQAIKMKVTAPNHGAWYKTKDFEDETEALKWCNTQLGKTDA